MKNKTPFLVHINFNISTKIVLSICQLTPTEVANVLEVKLSFGGLSYS